ncbi:hypothetical protein P691DRAFT_777811 [Macrolepiota fuliginosa MF-IS2]|uniref:F-box domain-containing protein n=1 Tax=Macrolepiota fuliginosa MF-IS2 TaxID=1400762 RepID=A0A9P6C101_9AGAR|nr:hypothetical protein P691DRAFT_777811 [Macrolepiota fuliginosa MF-IS2]
MLHNLPPELLLSVLKHLSVSDIAACCATSSTLKTFIDEYEATVYRQAAAHPSLHLIPHDQILFLDIFSLNRHSRRFLAGTNNWKDLCRRACEVRLSWLGKGPSRTTSYDCGSSGSSVHRIKVDERRRFYITTHLTGGLTVADIDEGNVIWGLKAYYVRGLAHCEYGEGFLIFDRSTFWHGGHGADGKEVWRLVSEETEPGAPDPDEFEVVPESRPDNLQLHPVHSHPSAGRLKFVPHAFLRPPANAQTRAFRFVYPTLLMGGDDSLFLWDVRNGKLVDRMDGIQTQMPGPANESPVSDEKEVTLRY